MPRDIDLVSLTPLVPRRELMMRDGEVEPLEGIVIFSSLLAARPNIRILAQVGHWMGRNPTLWSGLTNEPFP